MSRFIKNLNEYLSRQGIKQKFLSIRSGMTEDKISKLLNEKQVIDEMEMEKLADALGKDISFFLGENLPEIPAIGSGRLAFYAGEPGEEQKQVAYKLINLIENLDEVFNSSAWYNAAGGGLDEF